MRRVGRLFGTLPLALCLLGATSQCPLVPGSKERKVEFGSVFRLPAQGQRARWLETPWPSDVDVREDGTRIMDTFPNPTVADMLEAYRTEAAKGSGWGLNGSTYFQFEGPLKADALPSPNATMGMDGAVQLIDVDADSPEKGTRIPLRLSFQGAQTEFLPANTLVALPVLGFPLRPGTTYALLALDGLQAGGGGLVSPAADLTAVLAPSTSEARLQKAHQAFAPLRDAASSVGVDLSRVVHATVFTTADPMPQLQRARDRVVEGAPYATSNWQRPEDFDSFRTFNVYEGEVDIPQFQAGTAPFDNYDGQSGGFVLDTSGTPLVQRTERVRFSMSVPKAPPASGSYCAVIVAHGTGGDYRSMVGQRAGDETSWLTDAGCAAISISQPLHRTRAGFRDGAVELLTFNFLNPPAGTGNWRQSALESVALLHSLPSFEVPANVSATGRVIRLRGDARLFFGHSQGGITGAIMAGVEPQLDVAVLSGAGGGFGESNLDKTDPVVIREIIRLLINLPAQEPLDEFHPIIALLQLLADVLEPLNAARRYYAPERKPPNMLIYSGLLDTFTPPRTHGPLAGAAGIPLLNPVSQAVPALDLRGMGSVNQPLSNNLTRPMGSATAALVQWPNNGHFAVYEDGFATAMAQLFFQTWADTGTAQAIR